MADVQTFRGIRYSLIKGNDISDKIAPPYDVLSAEYKEKLLSRSPYNIVKIDLPFIPPNKPGPEEVYERVGKIFFEWIEKEILIQERFPTLYPYQQKFVYKGKEYTRRGFIARLKLEAFGKGSVFPHEKTYGGPKEDRFLLTKHTKANISQVFCLFDDEGNHITDEIYNRLSFPPTYYGTLEGVTNEIWTLTDRTLSTWLTEQMQNKKVFIADGHHRYSTAIMYRDYLKAQGQLTDDHPANYTSCVFVAMEEPGLLILPTHRYISNLEEISFHWLENKLKGNFEIHYLDIGKLKNIDEKIEEFGKSALGFVIHNDKRMLIAKPIDEENLLAEFKDRYIEDWRRLAVAILHHHVCEKIIYPEKLQDETPTIEYFHRADEVLKSLQNNSRGLGIIVPATPIEAVRNISLANQLMPQKSTYFYPKVATGLVIYPLF